MNLSCADIVRAVLGEPAKRQGIELLFRCPNHDDQHPSLSINPQKNCWMCGPCDASGNAWELAAFLSHLKPDDKAGITAWLRQRGLLSSDSNEAKIEAAYDYVDEDGKLLYQVVRFFPKHFKQRRPDGKGSWVRHLECSELCKCRVKLAPVRCVLYRLPEIRHHFFSGEKDGVLYGGRRRPL